MKPVRLQHHGFRPQNNGTDPHHPLIFSSETFIHPALRTNGRIFFIQKKHIMKNVLLLGMLLLFSGCLKNQWEERLENGDVDFDSQTETTPTNTSGSPVSKSTYTPAVVDGKTIDGKALFKVNCTSCHSASTKRTTGPGLQGVLSRIPGGDWKYNWVRNSTKLIESGDAYANKIFNDYNKSIMTPFPALSNAEIDEILRYADGGQ